MTNDVTPCTARVVVDRRVLGPEAVYSTFTAECGTCGWIGQGRLSAQRAHVDCYEHDAGRLGVPSRLPAQVVT